MQAQVAEPDGARLRLRDDTRVYQQLDDLLKGEEIADPTGRSAQQPQHQVGLGEEGIEHARFDCDDMNEEGDAVDAGEPRRKEQRNAERKQRNEEEEEEEDENVGERKANPGQKGNKRQREFKAEVYEVWLQFFRNEAEVDKAMLVEITNVVGAAVKEYLPMGDERDVLRARGRGGPTTEGASSAVV